MAALTKKVLTRNLGFIGNLNEYEVEYDMSWAATSPRITRKVLTTDEVAASRIFREKYCAVNIWRVQLLRTDVNVEVSK